MTEAFRVEIWSLLKGLWEDPVASKAGRRAWAQWGSRAGEGLLARRGAANGGQRALDVQLGL